MWSGTATFHLAGLRALGSWPLWEKAAPSADCRLGTELKESYDPTIL